MYHKSPFPGLPKILESNVHHLLLNRPDQKEWPDYTLFVNVITGQRRSFREFVERVRDGATALGADMSQGGLGLRPENEEVVGILGENCLDYITLIHSLLVITVPFVLFSFYATPYEFENANSLAQPTRIFASLPADRIYLLEGENEGYTSYDQLVSSVRKNGIPRIPVRHATKDTLAYMLFSSGTSGLHKVVMLSHGNITHAVLGMMVYGIEIGKVQAPPVWNTPEGIQVVFNIVPVYHALGLYSCSVILSKWDINVFFDSIPKYQITNLLLVPSLVHQIIYHPRFKTGDLSSVKTITCAAAYLPSQLSEQLRARFPDIETVDGGFGLSESAAAVSLTLIPGMLNGHAKSKPGSSEILLPGTEARIVRPDGSLAGPNEAGELHIRSNATALGYKGNDNATRETFVDGWLRTGDRIRIDNDGDTLKVSGMQVAPVEIENTLLAQQDKLITDVTVAGVSGGRTSDERILRAALGEKEVVARLDAWVQERLSRYKWLRGGIGIVAAANVFLFLF
ncbi:acetyl-CoA synthetase-like protein [Rhizopogon vinicolor AM-OR11-026]|uniref:Acetyl-CoA synthetase-like protein n=1 Tax=Rhizopogon vinicolor AM-OR11-026 TaxID=1314800 RepID=A0A1B7MMY0_9AGAM|nr:acetyl-CoA synthetase-like protein [Rhizopogon vinicolor AM-OR11-026]